MFQLFWRALLMATYTVPRAYGRLREWPKKSLDLGFWDAGFTGMARGPIGLAEEDGFQPALDHHNSSWNPH